MKDSDLFKRKDVKVYLIFIGILIIVIAYYNYILSILSAIGLAYFIYKYIVEINSREKEWGKYIESLADEFDSVTQHAVFNMPFPLVMLNLDYTISWYNTKFLEMVGQEDILNKKIDDLIPNINIDKLISDKDQNSVAAKCNNQYYEVYYTVADTNKSITKKENKIVLYWINDTKYVDLLKEFNDKRIIVCIAYIDNYDEVRNNTSEMNRPLVLAEIDKIINTFAAENEAIVRKYESDKYIIVMERKFLQKIQNKRFDILDKIREIDKGNDMRITLSMGVGVNGKNPTENYEFARAAIDIALGRGGDQVVIKDGNNLSFYGGKTKAIEKRNKVKSRVIAHALMQLIDQSDEVFVMGHKNADMDSFGAAVGIISAAKNRGKDGFLILEDVNPSIKNIYNRIIKEEPEYLHYIITPEEAKDMIYDSSLLVIVDNHKPSFTEAPELLNLTDKIVVIDHHRRGAEFIKDPVLTYQEPYASSTCELVTEMLYYMQDKLKLNKYEADALLAGITVDTKSFTFQTGVRTFEAASILKRAGADTSSVRQLFRDDYDVFVKKAEVIKNSKILFDKIAIGILNANMENSVLIAAQSANDLLNINDVEASFVLADVGDKIHISGRSLGNISVQLILEKLGGGGHLNSAGTQIEGKTVEEVEKMLKEAIEEYLKEGEK